MLDILYECIVVNFLFVIGTLLGLGILGIGPSLMVGNEFFKQFHLKKEQPNRIVKRFFNLYRKNFFRGNAIALPLEIVFVFFRIDLKILEQFNIISNIPILVLLVIFQLIFSLLVSCSFPMAVYYQLKPIQSIKKSSYFLFYNSLTAVISCTWLAICITITKWIPGLFLFLSCGIWLFGNSAIYFRAFVRNENLLHRSDEYSL